MSEEPHSPQAAVSPISSIRPSDLLHHLQSYRHTAELSSVPPDIPHHSFDLKTTADQPISHSPMTPDAVTPIITTPISHSEPTSPKVPQSDPSIEAPLSDPITRSMSETEKDKVSVVLRPVGNAPMLQKQRYNVDQSKTVQWMAKWIKNKLKSQTSDSIIIFTAQHFAPPLDQQVGNLYDCFGANDKLVVHYATQPAWG